MSKIDEPSDWLGYTLLATRMTTTYQLAKKQKVWDGPKKRKKLESSLSQIESLLSKEK